MTDEAAFLAAIAAEPDEDTPRLAFADWLDENDRPDEAELVRVQCELEPVRATHGAPRTDELHKLNETLYWAPRAAAINWFADRVGDRAHDIEVVFRRGFAEELWLPVQWVIEHGAEIRAHFPLLQKLAVFRLNGWGERLAACEHLRGLRELDLGCWYSDTDAEALAGSPHLADLERRQVRVLAGARAWPKLRKLRLVFGGRTDGPPGTVAAPTAAQIANGTGKKIAEVIDPDAWLFPFAADFGAGCFFVGKRPDGTQVFATDAEDDGSARAVFFTAAGDVTAERPLAFPPDALAPRSGQPPKDRYARLEREKEFRAKRLDHLRAALGFEPGFVRVRAFRIGAVGPSRYRDHMEHAIGGTDDPEVPPEADYEHARGVGRVVYDWVTNGAFLFQFADGCEWWCDGHGRVTSV